MNFLGVGDYSKTKTSWHLWAEHEASLTRPNFHLRAVFFVMESNIAYNLESEYIEYVLYHFILVHISDLTHVHFLCSAQQVPACFGFTIINRNALDFPSFHNIQAAESESLAILHSSNTHVNLKTPHM